MGTIYRGFKGQIFSVGQVLYVTFCRVNFDNEILFKGVPHVNNPPPLCESLRYRNKPNRPTLVIQDVD